MTPDKGEAGVTLETDFGPSSPLSLSSLSALRSFRRSLAVWYRSSGSFTRECLMMRPSSRGSSGLRSLTSAGVSRRTDDSTDMLESPLNGR